LPTRKLITSALGRKIKSSPSPSARSRLGRDIGLTLSLAFLAPQLVKAAVEGHLRRGISIEGLRNPSAEWSRQFEEFGLDPD
jgi:site-specific DNA recombinase